MLCRLYAKQLSEIVPILKNNDIEIVGIGCEELGGQEFIDGKFFSGGKNLVLQRTSLSKNIKKCYCFRTVL